MADHGPVTIREGNISNLIDLYHQAYKKLASELISSSEAGLIRKAQTMARIKAILNDLGDDANAFIRKEIPQYYYDGVNVARQDLKNLGANVGSVGTVIDKQAISVLMSDVGTAFAEGMTGIGRSASKVLSFAQKQQIQFTIAQGKLRGEALRTIAAGVKQQLEQTGLASLVDSAGRRWSFDTYAEMLARTKAVEARNQGIANQMLASGFDLVQVSVHNSDHPECAVWEGKILSITGQTPVGTTLPGGFVVEGTLQEATAAGLFHPNCKHAINVFTAELAAKTSAYDNPGQIETADRQVIQQELNPETTSRKQGSQAEIEKALIAGNRAEAQRLVNALPENDPYKASMQAMLDFENKAIGAGKITDDTIRSSFDVSNFSGNQASRNAKVANTFNTTFPDLAGYTKQYNWTVQEVPMDSLHVSIAASAEKVDQYVKSFKDGDVFPTLLVTNQGGAKVILDGAHRYEALQRLGITKVPVLMGTIKK